MSNLLKRGSTVAKEERVIDYNDIIRLKLENIVENTKKTESREPDEDGFIHGLDAEVVEQLVGDDEGIVQDSLSPEQAGERIQEANDEAEKIIASANEEASSIIKEAELKKQEAFENASKQGYEAGLTKADHEISANKARLETEYEAKHNELEKEYSDRMAAIEPQLVDVITEVFREVVSSEALGNKDILMHLIDTALAGAEKNHEYVIKVSPADYDFVSSNQGKISCHVDRGLDIEIQEDASFEPNKCVIETDGAVFDCSLDVELDALIKKIRMLSCTG